MSKKKPEPRDINLSLLKELRKALEVLSNDPYARPIEVCDKKLTGFIIRGYPKTGRLVYSYNYARGKKISIGRADTLKPEQARERARKIMAEYVANGIDPQSERRKAKAHTLESYILTEYVPWVNVHHRDGAATIKRIKTNFFGPFGKQKLDEITAWNLDKWRSERMKAGTKATTVNRDINALKAALSRAIQWGFMVENPLSSIKPVKVDSTSKPPFLTDEEENLLRTALDTREALVKQGRSGANTWRTERGYKLLPDLANGFADHLKPLVILAINTGLRRGELFNLKWADVDLKQASLTIIGEGAKSGQTRHIPLNDEALALLSRWKTQSKKTGHVFPSKSGSRLTNINISWRNLIRNSGITRFRFHDLRHHFASRLVMAGVDLNTVRELLGHGDIKMTLRYAHLAPAIKAAAVQKLVRGENGGSKAEAQS